MRISAKGKYGLASMIYLAQNMSDDYITVLTISENLGISKIYLEQVFSLLKKAELVNSVKGSSGGYKLSRPAEKITAYDILSAVETTLFEPAEAIASDNAAFMNKVISSDIWNVLDNRVREFLSSVPLSELAAKVTKEQTGHNFMYYI